MNSPQHTEQNPLHLTEEEQHAMLVTFCMHSVALPTLSDTTTVLPSEIVGRASGQSSVCANCILYAAHTAIICPYFHLCAAHLRPDHQSVIFYTANNPKSKIKQEILKSYEKQLLRSARHSSLR